MIKSHTPNVPKVIQTVSVIIPTYNEQKFLAKALKNLKKQDYKGNLEIIIADNGSTDETVIVAKRYNAHVVNVSTKGVAFARDAGFRHSTGHIIASTDADSLVPSDWISRIVKEFEKDAHKVMVSGMYTFYDGGTFLNFLTSTLNYHIFKIFGWHSGANMAIKRDAFLKIGGFNTSLILSEDSDIGTRLKKIGTVTRLANLKVQTSARRFNKLGIWGGIWDYCYLYFKFKLNFYLGLSSNTAGFRSGSEIKNRPLVTKLFLQLVVISTILITLLGGALEIKPVRAEVLSEQRMIHSRISNFDLETPKIDPSRLPFRHHAEK